MKKSFTLSSFGTLMFYFACLLSFSLFFGCGDTEETETETTKPFNPIVAETAPDEDTILPNGTLLRIESIRERLDAKEVGVPRDWEQTKDPVLRAAYARYLLSRGKIDIPPDWYMTKDPVLNAEYKRAQLTKQFGNIPAVRIFSDFTLKQALGLPRWTTLDEYIIELEANYFLFPNAANLHTLQEARKQKREGAQVIFVRDEEFQLLKAEHDEDHELWIQLYRTRLINDHGDIPEVHIVVDFMRKLALQLPRTDAECNNFLKAHSEMRPLKVEQQLPLHEEYAILEAQDQLQLKMNELAQRRLETFREAKTKGIPFLHIDWNDEDDA